MTTIYCSSCGGKFSVDEARIEMLMAGCELRSVEIFCPYCGATNTLEELGN